MPLCPQRLLLWLWLTGCVCAVGLCDGSLLKALCCSCALTLALNAFRNKLLWS